MTGVKNLLHVAYEYLVCARSIIDVFIFTTTLSYLVHVYYSCGAAFPGNIRTSLLKYHVSVTPEFDTLPVCTTEIVDMERGKVDLCKKIKK